jgi:hypothetical protein
MTRICVLRAVPNAEVISTELELLSSSFRWPRAGSNIAMGLQRRLFVAGLQLARLQKQDIASIAAWNQRLLASTMALNDQRSPNSGCLGALARPCTLA